MERGGIELISQADLHSGLTPLDCALHVGNEALARMLAERLVSGDDSAASELLEQAKRRVLEPSHAPLSIFRVPNLSLANPIPRVWFCRCQRRCSFNKQTPQSLKQTSLSLANLTISD